MPICDVCLCVMYGCVLCVSVCIPLCDVSLSVMCANMCNLCVICACVSVHVCDVCMCVMCASVICSLRDECLCLCVT